MLDNMFLGLSKLRNFTEAVLSAAAASHLSNVASLLQAIS